MLKQSLLLLSLATLPVRAASLSLSGNARFGTNMFNNLDLTPGTWPGVGNSESFFETRLLIRPDIVVDDRFTIRTEWVVAPGPGDTNDLPPYFGTALGNSLSLGVSRAYLDWVSDWGVFSVGRMPKNWGLGLLYDAGNDPYDDFVTTRDRASFKALLGNLALQIGYEKLNDGLLSHSQDDADAYELSIEYSNPESMMDVGLLYTRNVAMTGSPAASDRASVSSHFLSVYSKKRWDRLQVGGELVNESAKNYSVIGMLAQIDYMPGVWELGMDIGFASGSDKTNFSFHPNYKPFLILFNQSAGPGANPASIRGGASGASAVGQPVGQGTGNGAFLTKLSATYGTESQSFRYGMDVGYANLARQGSNAGTSLGVETDLHLTQKWYDNFRTTYALGFLFPGTAFGTNPQVAWGLQIRGALVF